MANLRLPQGTSVLFQGDSITDGGRGRDGDPNHVLGHSYAFLVAGAAGGRSPGQRWTFSNRGVSGDRVTDLAARWQTDTLDLAPGVVSVLVGINDAAADVLGACEDPDAERYREVYDGLLRRTREALPGVRLVLGEPFSLPVGPDPHYTAELAAAVAVRQNVVAALAADHDAVYVRYQRVFDAAVDRAPASYWIWDGIHPTYAGHQLMADAWVRAVSDTEE